MNPELRDKIKATLEGRSYSSNFLGGDTISQAPPKTPFERLGDNGKLPSFQDVWRSDFFKVPREALFGTGQDFGEKGKDAGAVNFFYGGLTQDQGTSYQNRYDELVRNGVDPKRAEQVAVKGATESFSFLKPGLTGTERMQLAQESAQEVGVKGLELLDFVTTPAVPIVGSLKKISPRFAELLGKTGLRTIAKETSDDAIKFTLTKFGARQIADDAEIVSRLTRATNESQVARIIGEAEQQFARDAELAARVQQRVTQPATRDAAQTTTRATTPVDMTRVTTRTAPQPAAVEPATIINPSKTKQDIRTKVKETLEQEQLVKDQVFPSAEKPDVDVPLSRKIPDQSSTDRARIAEERFRPLEERAPQKRGVEQITERMEMDARIQQSRLDKEGVSDQILFDDDIDALKQFMDVIGKDKFNDVRLSIRSVLPNAQGQFDFANAIVSLSRRASVNGATPVRVMVHELWHSLSRYLPDESLKLLQFEYKRIMKQFQRENKWFDFVVKNSRRTAEGDFIMSEKAALRFKKQFPAKSASVSRLKNGTYKFNFDEQTYRFKNIDEFFVEELTDRTVGNEFSKPARTLLQRIKKMFWDVFDGVQRKFGKIPSTERLLDQTYDDFVRQKYDSMARRGSLGGGDDVVNKATGPDATPKKGQADAGQVSLAASRPSPKGQGVELPPKTSQNSEILDSLNKSNPEQAKKASQEYTAFKEAFDKEINSTWSKIREKFQDSFIAVRKLQQQVANGGKIPDDINIDQAETLFHGRVHTKLEEVKDEITVIDRSITDTAKKFNISADEMRTDVDSYLHALHAPERNAKLGDGAAGITNKEAQATMDALKKTGRYKEIKAEAEKLLDLNRRTLDILKDSEMIDQKTYDLLKETYKNHIPLQRVVDDTEDLAQFLSGKGFDVKSTGLKRAKGSDKPVADITTNIATNVQQAIIRSEKNLVNLTTLRWTRANKDLGIIKEVKPKAIGKSFDGEGVILENLSNKPNIISLREKGKPVYLEVQDARLAVALKGVNVEQVPSLLKGVTFLTRLYGQLHTRFNYEFAFRNNIRDIQEMAVDVASREGMGFGAAGKSVARDVQSKAAITDFLFGRDTEGSRLYKQMKEDGGTTGGMGLSTRAQIEVDINNIRKLNQSKPRQAALAAIKLVDKWNTLFEDASRLSVYRTALDNGLSRKQAAVLAKESTINFNKKGTAGPLLNGLYMFSNASIQGTTKIMRAMKNPKVAAATTATIGSAVYAANEWNDTVDPDWRDKVTKYDRTSNLVIMLPSTDQSVNYITVPVSWGLKPIKMTMEYMHDLSKGKVDVVDGAQGILLSVAQSYNPLAGDESLLRTLTPTVLKTPFEIAFNRGWHGSRIKPDYDINAPASSQYFPSLADSVSGQFFINATELLSNKGVIEISPADAEYAFRQYIGGVGRSIDKLVTTVSKVGKGEEVPANQRPILSSFFKTRDQEQVYNDLFYSRREQADKEKSRERILDKRRVQPIYEEVQLLIDSGQTDKAQTIVDNLSEEDYEVYKKLKATDARRANVGAQIEQYDTVRRVEELIQEGKRDEALRIVEQLSDEEYKAYKDAKSALGVEF